MPASSVHAPRREADHSVLSPEELHCLTLFKWRYALESLGFNRCEAERLMFVAWLRATSRISG